MPFRDVLGQEQAVEDLRRALAGGRTSHAYLFRGPNGVGKTRLALVFAAALLCGRAKNDACGKCAACARIAHGNHPDVDLIEHPPGKRFISIEQIRTLNDAAHRTMVEASWRVFIIREAERLQEVAQNALLKTLEEPPPNRVIILVTARPDRLLPTIHSRCHQVRFQPLSRADMVKLLAREGAFAADEVEFAVAVAGGSMARALTYLQTGAMALCAALVPRLEHLRHDEVFALATTIRETVAASEGELEGKRDEARLFLDLATAFFRDLVTIVEGGAEALYLPAHAAAARRAAARLGPRARRAVELLWQARERLEANANIRLTLEDVLLGIAELQPA